VACGKPVIACIGGNAFLEELGIGLSVHPDDLEAIRAGILRYLSMDTGELEALSQRAVEFAKNELSINRQLEHRMRIWMKGS
jgi:glycosyltransferase involved in cell wall biosynthesis